MRSFDSPLMWGSLRTAAHRRAAGFTLLEILVVVVIIGIMATLAVVSIGNRPLEDRLADEARRLDELMSLAADEAVLQGAELGFIQTTDGYGFVVLKDGKWAPLDDAGPLRLRALKEPLYLRLQVDGRPVAPLRADRPDVEFKPHVLLLSSGDATEFTLDVHAQALTPFWRLQGDVLGHLKLERRDAPS